MILFVLTDEGKARVAEGAMVEIRAPRCAECDERMVWSERLLTYVCPGEEEENTCSGCGEGFDPDEKVWIVGPAEDYRWYHMRCRPPEATVS